MVDRKKGLEALRRQLSDGALSMLSEQPERKVLPTGIATLDSALGTGGLVRGQQVIFYGPPDGGKSALAYTSVGNLMARDADAMACIVDIERSASPDWLSKFGIDPERTVIIKEPTIEESVNAFQQAMRSCAFDYIIVDSLGAVIRSADFDGKDGKGGDANKAQVGGAASVITRWVNKANAELVVLDKMELSGTDVIKPVIIFINQVRDNFNSMYGGLTMPGGHALRHMSKTIIRVTASGAAADRMFGTVNGKKVQVGTRVTCKIERNKNAPDGRLAGYDFCWEECPEYRFGIDSVSACYDLAVENGVIETRGAWCYYGKDGEPGFVKQNGRAAMISVLRDNPEFMEVVYAETMNRISKRNDEEMSRMKGEVDV